MRLGPAEVRFTSRAEGDLGHAGSWVAVDEVDPVVHARRRAVLDRPWSWLRQVHGATVVVVDVAGAAAGEEADAAVTQSTDAALCVLTADCAPIALATRGGAIGVVHAGWKGLLAGVIPAAVEALRGLPRGDGRVVAALGPCIRPECYEFSPGELDRVALLLGPAVRSSTDAGDPALDLPAAVARALEDAKVDLVHDAGVCTSCQPGFFSHRARAEVGRQATVVWIP